MLARALTPSGPCRVDVLPCRLVGWLKAKAVFAAMQQMGPSGGDDHACRRYALQAIDAQAQADALRERLREMGGAQEGAWVQHQRWACPCQQPCAVLHDRTVLEGVLLESGAGRRTPRVS